MVIRSKFTNQLYSDDDDDYVFFGNMAQSAFYYSKGANLVDIFVRNGKWVFVFPRKDHLKYVNEWNKRKEEIEKK